MPAVFEHHRIVKPEEIDELGHVGNLRYLQWAVDAAVAHSSAQGWDADAYLRLGAVWVVRSHQIEYLRPAYAGEPIVVEPGWPASAGRRRYDSYRILRGNDRCCWPRRPPIGP